MLLEGVTKKMDLFNSEEIKHIGRHHTKLYNELESLNLQKFQKGPKSIIINNSKDQKVLMIKPSKWPSKEKLVDAFKIDEKNQFVLFQKTMKLLFFCGQCIGLLPVVGISETDPKKLRFKIFSIRFIYSTLIFIGQTVATILCTIRMFSSVDITKVAFTSFYLSTSVTTFLFMRVAAKWPMLVQAISKSGLNEYINPKIKFKCYVATITLLSLALLEHILSFISKYAMVLTCSPEETEIYEQYSRNQFLWFYDTGAPYNLSIGILLQFLNVASTMNWNYSDLFIVCVSLYLTSILQKIKEKIIMAKDKYLPPPFWSNLREDYTRATRLIRSFDDIISGVTFYSFATNLFFICLQLFNVLSSGTLSIPLETEKPCTNLRTGPFGGYEHFVYFFLSVAFILGRSIVVSLIAAGIHAEALSIRPPLYEVPTSAYCEDVQRFIEQVHSDNIALSGLQFFYVTKELVLSVAATVVTYELVLLQFSGW